MSFLSTQSGNCIFVYSSNKINIGKTVSLSVKDKTLTEVLGLIGKQVDMFSRIEGRHVTIKGDETAITHPVMATVSKRPKTPDVAETLPAAREPVIKYYAPKLRRLPPYSRNNQIEKRFERLQPYFDSTFLKTGQPITSDG